MKTDPTSPRQYVSSGHYVVSESKKKSLEALLGSCVGVTLCDKASRVGGLIHLLLPEPTGLDKPWKAGIYATTGLPLFVQALCDAGARKSRLEACVAGGALVGPVSRQDLDLDIGGRTTEVVRAFLREEGIPLKEEETGGYFSCRLNLDLETLESSIYPIDSQPCNSKIDFKKPTAHEIDGAIRLARPIPQIALKVARMIHSGDHTTREVAKEIKQEQIISAKVITLCNSVFSGLKKRIDSIDRAIVILGEKLLLKLVVSASLEIYFSDYSQGYSLCRGGLFQHALKTAIVAEELAKFTGRASPDRAYTAGLLHDIGKIVLDQYISSTYPYFYRRTQIDGIELSEAERDKLGVTHTEAGGTLAESWQLPESLTDTIKHHHYPERASIEPGLTHLVYLADLLMSRFQVGQELECLNMENLALRLEIVGLSPAQFPIIIDLIPQGVFDALSPHDHQ